MKGGVEMKDFFTNNKKLITNEFVKELVEVKHFLAIKARKKGILYMYKDGVYQPVTQDSIYELLSEYEVPSGLITPHLITEIETLLYFNAPKVSPEDLNNPKYINFKNGLVNIYSRELMKHTPDIFSTRQLPYNYERLASFEKTPVFFSFLDDLFGTSVVDQDWHKLVCELIGATLSNVPGYKYKKCFFFVGPGNTGKSVLRELVISLLDRDSKASLDLERINERFGTSPLVGKRLVGSGDLSIVKSNHTEILKQLTGGDDMQAEIKAGPIFSFKYTGFLWFNSNTLPKLSGDTGQHVLDRIIIVPCNNVVPFDKRDSSMLEKLQAESEAIVNFAIHVFFETVRNNFRFTETEGIFAERKKLHIHLNTLEQFLEEKCEVVPNGRTNKTEFYNQYVNWCISKNYPHISKKEVKEYLTNYGVSIKRIDGFEFYTIKINYTS